MSVDFDAPYWNPRLSVEERLADLLGRMTLEEKVAQMSLAHLDERKMGQDGQFEPDYLDAVLGNGVGEIFHPARHEHPPRQSASVANALQHHLRERTRLGIPALLVAEALHGLMARGSTSFPQAIALASTWDPALVQQAFAAAAAEARARGIQHALTPVLDLARDPRWGRTEETYGEDPHLVARMGVAAICGMQGKTQPITSRHILATAKHFAVHGQPESGRNAAPANYSEREIRSNFLVPFQAAVVEAGVQAVMASYNEIDGIPVHANRWLLWDVLRQEWGFEGFVTSDGGAITQLHTTHKLASSLAEAVKLAVNAGVDFELDKCFGVLPDLVRQGQVPEARIDEAAAYLLRAKFMLGLFENPYVDPDEAERVVNCPAHKHLAAELARRAIVLVKNDPAPLRNGALLPLDPGKIKSLAVIGPNAADVHLGGYSSEPDYGVSVLEGIRQKAGEQIQVRYVEGCRITEGVQGWAAWGNNEAILSDKENIAEAVQAAREADVALLVLGENESTCREAWSEEHRGDRDSLDLLGHQSELVQAVLDTGTPTVVLLINGRPLAINTIAERAPAILEGWYLGQATGTAVADVLFGEANPGGKLPITFPRSAGQLPFFYNHKPSARRSYLFTPPEPLFPFGHGLSYTTFRFEGLSVSPDQIAPDGSATVRVQLTNTGARAGDEVVQLYIRDQYSSVTRPVQELKAFQRITLQPGETRTVEFELGPGQLSFLGPDMWPVVEPGMFDVMVGPSSAQLHTVQLEVTD
ncbi:MAG: glycoside hydrolase family 3 C-terminal domain-containing protein [Thermoflexales bacterium]|nr:glycoside hydrolase family 3 C-terminal domain-containing protein [Thermoflexales bacterium]